jgi:diguanylate cyclase (GGDEF)-like protein
MAQRGRVRVLAWVLPYVAFAAILVLTFSFRGNVVAQRTLESVGYGAVELLGVGYSLRAATHPRSDRSRRRPWKYITAAWTALLLSGLGFGLSIAAGASPIGPPLLFALALRLLFLLLLVRGLLLFEARKRSPHRGWKLGFDVATVVGGGLMITWYALAGPTLASAESVTPTRALTAGYTIGDLLLVFGLCIVLLRDIAIPARTPLALLLLGCVAYLAVDVYITYESVHAVGVWLPGSAWVTVALLSPVYLMMLASVEQCRVAARVGEPPPHRLIRRPTWLPYAALAFGFSLLVVAAARSPAYPWWGLVGGAVLTTFAVTASQVIALRENHLLIITDSLTGLASRVELREALRRANDHSGQLVAVLHIDLDDFKRINDIYGHDTGDAYLVAFGDVLRRKVRVTDTAARLGGDEFVVVLNAVRHADQAVEVAERILAEADQISNVDGHQLRIRASIGIAVAAASTVDSLQILRWADQAMYVAKRRQSHGWRLYAEGAMEDDVDAMRQLLDNARQAGQLRCVYQPIVSLATGELVAVEALVRWQHPTRGLVPPLEFIPLAEDSGAIHDIGLWVVDEASSRVAGWRARLPSGRGLQLTVNVSPRQLSSETLAADVIATLDRNGLPVNDFVAEVTEVAIIEDGTATSQLELLHERGVRIALDDFGTGYSSLRYLTRLPVDILKLDRCFVNELNGTRAGSAVAEAVIRLAQILHLETVAEGIEHSAQATELTLHGYHNGQGYLYSTPLTAEDMDQLVAAAGDHWPTLGRDPSRPTRPVAPRSSALTRRSPRRSGPPRPP